MPTINIPRNIKDNPNEIWVGIKDYPKYEVSNLGRIISYHNKSPKILIPSIDNKGYKRVSLWNKNGNKRNILVHRIVAEHFIPKIKEKDFMDHIDGNSSNNKVTNLRWVNKKENCNNPNTINNLLNALNKNRNKRKRPVAQLNIAGEIIKIYDCVADAARELNIDKSKIAKVARGCMSLDRKGFMYNNFSAGGYRWKYI